MTTDNIIFSFSKKADPFYKFSTVNLPLNADYHKIFHNEVAKYGIFNWWLMCNMHKKVIPGGKTWWDFPPESVLYWDGIPGTLATMCEPRKIKAITAEPRGSITGDRYLYKQYSNNLLRFDEYFIYDLTKIQIASFVTSVQEQPKTNIKLPDLPAECWIDKTERNKGIDFMKITRDVIGEKV